MPINKIEAIVDAISKLNGCSDTPESESYKLRNPLMLKSFARVGKHETDVNGVRIFTSLLSGYKAATFDVLLKISGKSRANVKPDSTLAQLLLCYGIKMQGAIDNIVSFLRRALSDTEISSSTPLSYFLEENDAFVNKA